ncbi:MAG: ribose-phosphate pyrophosphokinase [Candidatus Methanomethylicaceae archaeon]|nr:ribose-phosphate pyrophosphokinase [Candidatus Verstraetearchaeota archaeon]
MIIVYESFSENLAKAIGKEGNFKIVGILNRFFPDGEQYVRILEDVEGDVLLIHSLWPNPDKQIIEYFLIIDALKGLRCKSINVLIPYLPYLRQDKRFKPGEPISARVIYSLIESVGIDRIITIDPHLHRIKNLSEIFKIECITLSAFPLMAEYYKNKFGNDVIVIGPDIESEQYVKIVSKILSTSYFIFEKERLGDRDVLIKGDFPIKNKVALIVDDIVSTGTTLANIVQFLLNNGALRVDALVSHALLIGDAFEKLKKAGLNNLITTDTVPNPLPKISIAPLISNFIKNKFKNL